MELLKLIYFFSVLNMLLFQDIIQSNISIFKYTDEILTYSLGIITIIIFALNKYKLTKYEKIMIIIMVMFMIIGIYEQIMFKNQNQLYSILDFLTIFKFLIIYLSSRIMFYSFNLYKYKRIINKQFRIVTVLLLSIYIINLLINIYPVIEVRMGIPVYELMFSHVTYLVNFCICNIFILSFYNEDKLNNKYIILNCLMIILTMRFKGIAFVFIYTYIFFIKKCNNVNFRKFIIYFIMIILVSWPYIQNRLFNETYARGALHSKAISIMKDYFPLGTGFGTFASHISGKYYSNVYYEYGINNIHGITMENYNYISDTFWPMIVGQTGFIGTILFIVILLLIIKNIWSFKITNKDKYIAMIPIIYLLITSTSESSFANYSTTTLLFIQANIINYYSKVSYKNKLQLYKEVI